MDIQNLEMPLVLFKDAADRVFDHANGIDVIDAVMRRYSDYAYLIRDIQACLLYTSPSPRDTR